MLRALLAVLLLALAGCGTTPDLPVTAAAASSAATSAVVAAPTAVTIPAIGARSTLIPLKLDAKGALTAPDVHQPLQAGWYAAGVVPGEAGPGVLAGHVDGEIGGRKGQPGIFYRLHELKAGDEVLVDRTDDSTVTFRVTRVERYAKAAFPTAAVYGDTAGPELRLITCGGAFQRAERSYRDNVVVYAVLEV